MNQHINNGTIMVTGGAGFLGSHLCDRLIERGHDVLCVDNFFTGTKRNIAHLLDNPHFELMRHDVTFPLYVEVDEIYNLACPASPDALPVRPGADHQDQRARRHQHAGPGQARQGADPAGLDQRGLWRPGRPPADRRATGATSIRSASAPATTKASAAPKRCSSTTTASTASTSRSSRIFNTYGPRMHPNDGRVVSNFIVQALRNEDITLYGDGEQTRSFCYVDDLIDGMMRMMDTPADITGPINLGNPDEFTMRELAETILQPDRQQVAPRPSTRCRRTTRASASRISRWRAAPWTGRPPSAWKMACVKPSNTSAGHWNCNASCPNKTPLFAKTHG